MKCMILLLICLIASSASAFKVNVLTREEVGDGLTCAICHFVANVVVDQLEQNASIPDIMTTLNRECGSLYNAQWISECRTFVSAEGQNIIPYVKNNPGANACVYISACSSDNENKHSLHDNVVPAVQKPSPVKGEIECGVCTFVATRVEYYISENHTESEIEGFLAQDCRVFSKKDWIATCQGLVDEFAPEIIQLAENKYPADVICQDIKFCNTTAKTCNKKKPVVPLPAIKADDDDIECHVCEWIATIAEKYIEENKTETEIVDTLADSCDVLIENSWVTACKELVEENGEEIVEYLLQDQSPEEVCEEVEACPSNFSEAIKQLIKKADADSNIECHVCEWIATIAEKYIEENKTETEIVDTLADSCDVLIENSWVTACKELVEENGEEIVEYLLQDQSPEEVCEEVEACPSNFSEAIKQLIKKESSESDVECSVCHWLTTLGEKYVEENKTESEIITGLTASCDILIDKSWISACHNIVEENGDLIVQYLLNKESPQVICEQIGACSSKSAARPAPVEEDVECSVCNWVATLTEKYIEQNKTESEIIDALSIACDVLIDKTYIEKCDNIVDENGDLIIQYLLNKEDPEEVCAQIGACPNNTSTPVVLVASAFRLLTPLLKNFL